MTAEKHNNIGRITALISFLIGTTFFAMHFFNHNVCIMIEGLLYIILAFFINIFILLIILGKAIHDEKNRAKLLQTIGIMLLNIPIVFLYCWVIFN